jgi:PAS domain S-box-containing protein
MINTTGFFEAIFKHAKENSVIIMSEEGNILHINKAFSKAFGYHIKDLSGKHFRVLFTEKDKDAKKPELEIKDVLASNSKSDNNYLIDKKGVPVWVMGESVSVSNISKEKFIVKIIQDIHAQKQLEHFLLESKEFIDIIFNSIKDVSLVTLDSGLKIIKVNAAFLKMFGIKKMPGEGTKLSQLENNFWKNTELKKQLVAILVTHKIMKNESFIYKDAHGKDKKLLINSKLIESEGREKSVLLVIKKEND